MQAKLPEYFGVLPKAPLTIKAVEAFREKSAGKAFYQSPAPDGSRPGVYYVNLYNLRDMPTTVEIRSATLTRGLPLMTIELLVRVLQRGGAVDAASPAMPVAAAPAVGSPTAPRLVPSAADLGVVR
jgi:hypothetical protein